MRLQVSENELLSTITRSLTAMGWPPGTDYENAKNAIWLEQHGIPGLRIILQEICSLKNLGYSKLEYLSPSDTEMMIGADINSSIIVAQMALDFALIGRKVTIKNCSGPCILLAEAARRSGPEEIFYIECHIKPTSVKIIAANNNLKTEKKISELDDIFDISIKLVNKTDIQLLKAMNELQKIHHPNGFEIAAIDWAKLLKFSSKLLVPKSERSRSGAGAEVDDNF